MLKIDSRTEKMGYLSIRISDLDLSDGVQLLNDSWLMSKFSNVLHLHVQRWIPVI